MGRLVLGGTWSRRRKNAFKTSAVYSSATKTDHPLDAVLLRRLGKTPAAQKKKTQNKTKAVKVLRFTGHSRQLWAK